MMVQKHIIIYLFTFLLTLQFVGCDFLRNNESRRSFQNGIRDSERKFVRFRSPKILNFETHGESDKRKSCPGNYLRNSANEAPTEFNIIPQSLEILSVSKLIISNVNRGRPDLNKISNLKRNSRLISENQKISPKLRYAMKTLLPNTDPSVDRNQIEDTLVTDRRNSVRRNNRIDRRMANERDNRLPLNVRDNRFREQFRSTRFAVSSKYNNGRFLPAKPTKYTQISNLQSIMKDDALDFTRSSLSRNYFLASRRDRLSVSPQLRESKKINSLQQRNDVFERVSLQSRHYARIQSQTSEISSTRTELLSKYSRSRRDRHLLVSRRELKIPTDETRRMENARSSRESVGNDLDKTILSRRNGRGFRGRFEMRNNIRDRDSTTNIRIRNYQNKERVERKVESIFFDQVAEPSKHQSSNHRRKDNLSPDARARRTLTRRIADSYQTHRHYDTQSFAEIRKTNNELRSVRHQVGRFSSMRIILKKNGLSNERRYSEENHMPVRQASINNSNFEEKRLFRIRNSDRIVRRRELPERQNLEKSVRTVDIRKELITFTNSDKLFTIDSDMPFRKQRTNLYANKRLSENRIQNKRSQTVDGQIGRDTNYATRRLSVQQKTRLNVDKFPVQVKQTNSLRRLDRSTRNVDTRNRIASQQLFKDNGLLLQQNARELKQIGRRISISNRRTTTDRYNIFKTNEYLHTRESNRRVRTQLQAHRIEDSSRKEINNKARIYSKRTPKDTYGTRDVFEYPKQRMGSEYFRALRIRDNLKQSEDHKKYNKELGRRDLTRLNWKSVKSVQADLMETIPFVESDINRYVEYSKTRDVFERMTPIKDSMRFSETPSINQRRAINLSKLKLNNEVTWAFSEYLSSKKSDILSFMFNIMLGFAVIVAVSDDMNKGFISRRKNQFIDCILRYSPVIGTEF